MDALKLGRNNYERSASLIGYYPFAQTNTDTSAYDRGGNENHLTKGAALTWDNNSGTGVWKNANAFTSFAATASANDFSLILAMATFQQWLTRNLDSLIISFRASITAPGADIPILGNTYTTTPGLRVQAKTTGKLYLQTKATVGATVTANPSTITVADGTPHHVVLGLDGVTGKATMYVDGVLDTVYDSATAFTPGTDLKSITRDFRIGGNINAGTPTYSSVAATWAELQILRLAAQGLPENLAECADALYRNPYLAWGNWAGV